MDTVDDEYDDYEYDNYSNQNNIKQTNDLDKNDYKDDKREDNDYGKEDNQLDDRILDKYEIAKYENLKYENNKNYEIIPNNNNYELIDDYDDDNESNLKNNVDEKKENENLRNDNLKFSIQQPKLIKKSQIKLIKDVKYPKSSTPKHYYPGRNFVHQRPSIKKDLSTTKKFNQKIKINSDKFINDELSTLIPLELYKHQIKSRFISNNDFTNKNNNKFSSRLQELETPQILNGELYCDCGFYLKLKNKKIDKLNSKLQKVSKEQKQMKRKLIEMAVKENQLQLICRSQSKANLKYFNKQNGKPNYLALSNATAQSNPINLL